MKQRILFVAKVTKTQPRGGTEKHLADLIARIDASCAECIILCMESDVYSQYLKGQQNVKLVKPATEGSVGFLPYLFQFRYVRPDRIIFVNSVFGLFPWYAYLAARLCGAKRVLAIEHLVADSPGEVLGAGLWNALRRLMGYHGRDRWRMKIARTLTNKTITVSDAVRDKLIHAYGYPGAKTVTILNGVDLEHFARSGKCRSDSMKTELGLTAANPVVLCISNLNPQKRIDVLLDAFHIVAAAHPKARCVILGSGLLEPQLRARAIALGLGDTVMFRGYVTDVRPYLEIADLFVLSSDKEGLPLSLGEAMAYGIPCVVTDAGGNREIVVEGETGYVVKTGAPEKLAEAISYLLAHDEKRAMMGGSALRRVQEYFDIENNMKQLKKALIDEA